MSIYDRDYWKEHSKERTGRQRSERKTYPNEEKYESHQDEDFSYVDNKPKSNIFSSIFLYLLGAAVAFVIAFQFNSLQVIIYVFEEARGFVYSVISPLRNIDHSADYRPQTQRQAQEQPEVPTTSHKILEPKLSTSPPTYVNVDNTERIKYTELIVKHLQLSQSENEELKRIREESPHLSLEERANAARDHYEKIIGIERNFVDASKIYDCDSDIKNSLHMPYNFRKILIIHPEGVRFTQWFKGSHVYRPDVKLLDATGPADRMKYTVDEGRIVVRGVGSRNGTDVIEPILEFNPVTKKLFTYLHTSGLTCEKI